MTATLAPTWESMRTDETRAVEQVLRQAFPRADAYRYNSASIRVRVIDPRFSGKPIEERDALVEPLLARLPNETQKDIVNLLTLEPAEVSGNGRKSLLNREFEQPTPSDLWP